jgi:glucosamine--fructose-6-phosphate aminotransferase (isomerizing)
MCGIFGYIGSKDTAASLVLEGLKSLEYRGYDSWGVAIASPTQLVIKKQIGKIGDASVSELPASTIAIGHTRWATHGGVTQLNAHPHLDCTHSIAVIHNGIVENFETLKSELQAKGHTFISETDSEVITHLLEENVKTNSFEDAFRKTFNQLAGLNAVIAIHHQERVILAARKGSPLVIGFGETENYVASDPAALLPYTKQVFFLDDGQMAKVVDTQVSITEVATRVSVTYTPQTLDWDVQQAELGEYPHFMLKEIYEQPTIVANIATNGVADAKRVATMIQGANTSYFLGCGSASYACLAGAYLFSKIAHQHINWSIGSEFAYQLDFVSDQSLIIALSQSGETMDVLEPLKKARQKGAQILALVNVLGSTLYRMADDKILIGAGPEKAVASTKAFTGKIAHLILLAHALANQTEAGQQLLLAAAQAMAEVLTAANLMQIKQVAQKIKDTQDVYVIGRGLSFPASLETALKIKEISYIHAEGLAGGELKHGPLALIEKGTPCIVLLPNDETYHDTLNGAMEMKARGGYVIGISHKPHDCFDMYLPINDVGDASLLPIVVTTQLLAYYLTLELELDPDKPRNLAKSVTVK